MTFNPAHLHDHLHNLVFGGVLSQDAQHIADVSAANLLAALGKKKLLEQKV